MEEFNSFVIELGSLKLIVKRRKIFKEADSTVQEIYCYLFCPIYMQVPVKVLSVPCTDVRGHKGELCVRIPCKWRVICTILLFAEL